MHWTMDAAHAFTWNEEDSRYEPLPENRIREITEAIEMAEGVRIIELSRLPIALAGVETFGFNER